MLANAGIGHCGGPHDSTVPSGLAIEDGICKVCDDNAEDACVISLANITPALHHNVVGNELTIPVNLDSSA